VLFWWAVFGPIASLSRAAPSDHVSRPGSMLLG
jgi:hypothetical protein